MKQSTRPSLVLTPHKGIRYAFAQITMKAGSIDYANPEQVADLIDQVTEFGDLLEEHAHLEKEYILAALAARVPGSADHDEQDHIALEELQSVLMSKLENLQEPGLSPQEANARGYAFYQDFSKLHAAHLEHMLEEEQVTQALLWDHFSDEEIMGLHFQIVSHIPPDKMLAWMQYIMPALNHAERSQLLKGMQMGAPAEFFELVMARTKSALSEEAFEALEEELMQKAWEVES
jgi:hypothetical protein